MRLWELNPTAAQAIPDIKVISAVNSQPVMKVQS
jgi:hypothetical protein